MSSQPLRPIDLMKQEHQNEIRANFEFALFILEAEIDSVQVKLIEARTTSTNNNMVQVDQIETKMSTCRLSTQHKEEENASSCSPKNENENISSYLIKFESEYHFSFECWLSREICLRHARLAQLVRLYENKQIL